MKTDTEYFNLAVDAWCSKNKYLSGLPATPAWLSQMLRNAQALKDADRKRLDNPEPTA